MHVMAVLAAIKKCGHFKNYEDTLKAYVEQKEVVKSVRAGLALLDGTSEGLGKLSKKLKKTRKQRQKPRMPRQSPRKQIERPRCPKTP